MEIRALTPAEQKYTYAQSMQLEGQTGTIGHLRGDFATTGYGFYTTWFDTRPQRKSDEFKADLDTVINALREDKGLLHNRYDMSAFARHFPESAIKGNYCTEYGFRVDTEKHAFLLRCNPTKGDYNFYCYCYVKEWLDKHIQKAEQGTSPVWVLTLSPTLTVWGRNVWNWTQATSCVSSTTSTEQEKKQRSTSILPRRCGKVTISRILSALIPLNLRATASEWVTDMGV